ncbi:MAG TPA: hypothetical protein VFN61_00415 [Acidimicrobiales bacterium]|nr:hypothetical protein [Acidimicrobiales bacterium]
MKISTRLAGLVAGGAALMASTLGATASAATTSASTSTQVPLKAACETNAATCGYVGTTQGFYNGQDVDFLYSQPGWCDTTVTSQAPGGCEAGAPANKLPAGVSSAKYVQNLYIPVPLFSPAPSYLQCPPTPGCIDHPMHIDLSRLSSALGAPASALANTMLPGHDHIVTTVANNDPIWWSVVVVGVTNPTAWNEIISAKSYTEIQTLQAQSGSGVTGNIPTNAYLFFQVLPGTLTTDVGVNTTAAPSGTAPAIAPGAANVGTAIDNLVSDCPTYTMVGQCENIGITKDYYAGSTLDALYTEPYWCDKTVSAAAPSGCEAGAAYRQLPPGVASASYTDPLWIPVPLFSPAPKTQCPSTGCVDHPMTIDLSRLASALGAPAAKLKDVPVPAHDHILNSRNNDLPEWWPVVVVGVTNQKAWDQITSHKNLSEIRILQRQKGSGVTGDIPTNLFLWFQTLPGVTH